MEYVPDPLNKIVKGNIPYKKYLSTPTIIAYTKCLLTALRDLHVNLKKSRKAKSVTETLNHQIFLLTEFKPNFVTSGLLKF